MRCAHFVTIPVLVDGTDALARELGGWPSFHDAEVVDFHLRRAGESILALQLANPGGTVVEFGLDDVHGLELSEFNRQNVIARLDVEKADGGVVIRLSPCYGMSGWIKAKSARVRTRCDLAPFPRTVSGS